MKKFKKNITLTFCSVILICFGYNCAIHAFIVKNIKVMGVKRVSTGTVLNYLPVQIGEELNPTDTASIIKTLYETGFFQYVSLERENNTLIVHVIERATIGAITISGNQEIPSDKLKELLKEMGLVKGRVFQRSSLEHLEKELKQAYNARGKYNAHIITHVATLTENRVAITITISEGRVSRIKEIKFIGNQVFTKNTLMSNMSLSESSMLTYFSKKDQYSKAAMDASLEALRSYYLDRGYLKFNIVSSQVLLAPDKKDVFINIHIEEGPQYRFSGYTVIGNNILPASKLESLILITPNAIFSRKEITESISAIGLALGDIGYGFPVINAEPRINENNKTVFITFIVNPGHHVYVRRIIFKGNTKTADYVLRNIIRQNEGSILSLHNIKESERHLRLLGYLKNINIKTTPVTGTNNQVDLEVEVEEAPSAEASASFGYGTTGPTFNAAFNQHNFMGTGRSLGLSFNASYWGQDYSISYYNPFYTDTGIGRGINFYYQTIDPKKLDISAYSSDRLGIDVNYNLLLSEKSSFQFGYGYQDLRIKSAGSVVQIQNFINTFGRNFHEIRLVTGWNRNSYDRIPFPINGINQQASVLIALPGARHSLSYYKTNYMAHLYYPLWGGFIFSALGNIAYGNTFQNHGLPFFENYYAGGIASPGQVRGYESYSLGPRDSNWNSIGANFLINGTIGLILPYPISRDTLRTTLFVDAGNVFKHNIPANLSGIAEGPLRFSAGIGLEWRSPFGPLAFSIAKPLNKQPFDEEQMFQFTLSSGF